MFACSKTDATGGRTISGKESTEKSRNADQSVRALSEIWSEFLDFGRSAIERHYPQPPRRCYIFLCPVFELTPDLRPLSLSRIDNLKLSNLPLVTNDVASLFVTAIDLGFAQGCKSCLNALSEERVESFHD